MNHKHAMISNSIVNSGMSEMLLATDRWMATLAHELRDP
jgi:hypothetical protein